MRAHHGTSGHACSYEPYTHMYTHLFVVAVFLYTTPLTGYIFLRRPLFFFPTIVCLCLVLLFCPFLLASLVPLGLTLSDPIRLTDGV